MKKLILLSALILIGFSLFAQRRVDTDILIVRDSIIMTNGKITDMGDGVFDDDGATLGQMNDSISKYSFVQPIDSIQLNPNIPDPGLSSTAYTLAADSLTGFITFKDDNVAFSNYLNATVEFPFVNTTGITLLKGTPISSDVIALAGGVRVLPTVEITVNNDIGLAQTFAGVVADDTPIGEVGRVLKFTFLDDYNTSGFAVRDILYVSDDSTLTNIAPSPPNYKIVVGRTLTSDVSGLVAVTSEAFTGSDTDVNLQGVLNGIITKKQAIRDTTIGGVIYFETFNENNPTEDLPYMAGQNSFLLNTTTNSGTNGYARVALTPGTSTDALTNYVYIDNTGTPTLSVSTAQFPTDGIRLGELNVNDITTHGTFGFASIQRFNNAVDGTEADGLLNKSVKRTRENGSKYESGSDATFEIITSGGLDSLKYSATSGEAWQFNEQTINSTGRLKYKWLNSPTGEQWINDLHDIDVDSEGNTLRSNNDIYGLNLFYVINSGDYEGYIAVNTPKDKYSTEANCINDVANFAIKTVPLKYDKVAFRHGRVVVKYSTTGGGSFTNPIGVGEFQDERGQPLGSGGAGAGSGSAVSNFPDADFTIFSNSDPTKIITFNATDSITTGTTRDQTIQDKDGVLAHLEDITLQRGYENNTKIVTNADSLAVKIQSGSGNDADNVQEWLNNAGDVVGEADGAGNLILKGTFDALPTGNIRLSKIGTNTEGGGAFVQFDSSISATERGSYNARIEGLRTETGGGGSSELLFYTTFVSETVMSQLRGRFTSDGYLELFKAAIADAYGTNVQTLTETAGAVAWDMSNGSKAKVTIDETSVITITNMPEGAEGTIMITQGDAGDDNVTFVLGGATVKWRGGDEELTDTSGAIDRIKVTNMDGILLVELDKNYLDQ